MNENDELVTEENKDGSFICPRSFEGPAINGGKATWEDPRGGTMGKYRSCSYCGSAHPDDFMQACRDGVEIGPTDKNYKAYFDGHEGKFYFQHLPREQKHEFLGLLNDKKLSFGEPGYFYVLPFFIKIEEKEAAE